MGGNTSHFEDSESEEEEKEMGCNTSHIEDSVEKEKEMGGNTSHIGDSDESPRKHKPRIVSRKQWSTHLDAVYGSNKLTVMEFTATWSGPCKAMEPILREYADKFTDVEFVKLDVDEFRSEAGQFSVQEMPSFVFLKGVEVVDKLEGARKDELQKKIEYHKDLDYNVWF